MPDPGWIDRALTRNRAVYDSLPGWQTKGPAVTKPKPMPDDAIRLTYAILHEIRPFIVKRPKGGCQVLFALTDLDGIVNRAVARMKRKDRR